MTPRADQLSRFATFFAVLLGVIAALGMYVYQRAAFMLGLSRAGRRVLAVALVAGVLTLPAGRLMRFVLPDGLLRVLSFCGWLLALSILMTAVLKDGAAPQVTQARVATAAVR